MLKSVSMTTGWKRYHLMNPRTWSPSAWRLIPPSAPIKSRQNFGNAACRLSWARLARSEEHTSELQSPYDLVCRLQLEKKTTHRGGRHGALAIGPRPPLGRAGEVEEGAALIRHPRRVCARRAQRRSAAQLRREPQRLEP